MLGLAILTAYAAGLCWLAWEIATAPVIDDDTGPDPWLAEDVRAALNGIDGVAIYESGAGLPRIGSGADTAPRFVGTANLSSDLPPVFHSSIDTSGAQQDHVAR